MRRLRILGASALAMAVAAPALSEPSLVGTLDNDVEDVRGAAYGDDFAGRLADDYRDLAVFEADIMVDWIDADWFAQRAKDSAAGNPPPPADPTEWYIESDARMQELQQARAVLMDVVSSEAVSAEPDLSAAAVASYDCWVEQQEEGWQEDDIAACRNRFLLAAANLGAALRDRMPDLAGRLFFEFDESELTAEARETLAVIADEIASENPQQVTVVGHADTVGTDEYNEGLSRRRAKTVANALRAMGVPNVGVETDIRIVAQGETEPLVETGEGVRMPLNRRVAVYEGEPEIGIATRSQ